MSSKTAAGGCVIENCDVVMATANLDYDDERSVLELAVKLNKGVIIKKGLQSGHADSVDAAFKHIFSLPAVSSMIVGAINRQHLQSNVDTINEIFNNS